MNSIENITRLVKQSLPAALDAYPDQSIFEVITSSPCCFELNISLPMTSRLNELKQKLDQLTEGSPDIEAITINQKLSQSTRNVSQQAIEGVSNIIIVASAKGGVGKSTTTANLALALAHEGAKVGILDADIYGPSQPRMLGVEGQRPELIGPKTFKPLESHQLQLISIGSLVERETAMAWRGPMATGALQQLLRNTRWQSLDYLLVDMPPGTGDIQLSISQMVPVDGAVIVTTPQDIAVRDAEKGIEFFQKVNIPILGVVENMSMHICSQCGNQEAIFGQGGGQALADKYQLNLLGQLPLQLDIGENVDSGKPSVIADSESTVSIEYRNIAMSAVASMNTLFVDEQQPLITTEDN